MISSFLLYLSNLQFHASFLICVPCCESQDPIFLLWQPELCMFGDGAGEHTFTSPQTSCQCILALLCMGLDDVRLCKNI